MDKRGQVTLFIIIAIVVVAVVLLAVFLTGGFKTVFTPGEVTQVKNYIQDCLELKTQDAILFIARQGGYNTLPQANINFLDEKTVYYWKNNQTLVPSTTTVESELKVWMDARATECLKMPGYSITPSTCTSQFEVKETVKGLFECPITLQKGAATTQISDFSIEVNAPVKKMLDVSSQIVAEYSLEYSKDKSSICLDCFRSIIETNNVSLTIVPITKDIFEPEHIWFLITDNNIKFDERNITWRFVTD